MTTWRPPEGRDTVDLNVEMPRPGRHADEESSGRVLGKVEGLDRVHRCELLHRSAVHIVFQGPVERVAGRLQTEVHFQRIRASNRA
jgi:hypothetical protein